VIVPSANRVGLSAVIGLCLCLRALAAERPVLRFFADPSQAITPLNLAEDANGDLWLAAEHGVFRFDGQHFVRIPGDFVGPSTVAILEGRATLVGADNGLFLIRNGSTVRLAPEPVYEFLRLDENLVLARQSQGIVAGFSDGNKFVLRSQHALSGRLPWAALDGSLWGVCGNSLCSVQNTAGLREAVRQGEFAKYVAKLWQVVPSMPLADQDFIQYALPDSHGGFFTRNSSVVYRVNPHQRPREYRVGGFTRAHWQPMLYQDHSGRIWVSGDQLWVAEDGTLRRFLAAQLEGKQVTAIFEDSRHHLWFGLTNGGLAVMGLDPIIESWATPESFGQIDALMRENSTTLLAATDQGMLLQKRGDSPWKQLSPTSDAPINQIDGAGGRLLGLIRLGPPVQLSSEGRVTGPIAIPPKTPTDAFRRLVGAADGTFFLGGQQPEGLYRITGNQAKVVPLPAGHNGRVQDIEFDTQGKAFVAFEGGVCRMEGEVCRLVVSFSDGLLSPKLRSIGIGPPGEIWVAYRDAKAFSRLRYVDGRWIAQHFTEANGFSDADTQFLRRDRRGWVWRGTGEGLFVSDGVHAEPQDWLQITEKVGLPSRDVNRFGYLEDNDGSIWIGTARGIAHLHPSNSWFTTKSAVRLSDVRYGGSSFPDPAIFPRAFQVKTPVSIGLAAEQLLPVRYRLLPKDADWHASRDMEVRFGQLDAGHYQFEATSGDDGDVARYVFDVTDPVRDRNRAVLLAGSALAGLAGIMGIAWRRKKLKARSAKVLPDLAEWRLAALNSGAQDLIGTTLDGRFKALTVVARGGFGTVFDGFDLRENRRCAIKVFSQQFADEWVTRRFQHEVAALEAISHPRIVRIYGHGATSDQMPYLVMDFVEGCTLREFFKDGVPTPLTNARLLRQLGEALEEIHTNGIFHRDLKPENIMIQSGEGGHDLVLIDFSAAVMKDPGRTMHGFSSAVGTMHYMAPEQTAGFSGVTSDIYSLAKVAIEMIVGERVSILFPDTLLDLHVHVRELARSLSVKLSPSTVDLLASALQFDPSLRPASAAALATAIAADLEDAT